MRSKNFTNEIFAFKVAGNSFFETLKDYIQSAQKPTFLLRGQTNFTRVNQRFEAWDCGRVMTIAIILLVLISVWERSRKFLDRFSHNYRIFFIEIMPRCRTYFNKWNLSVSKLWRRWFYSWIFFSFYVKLFSERTQRVTPICERPTPIFKKPTPIIDETSAVESGIL